MPGAAGADPIGRVVRQAGHVVAQAGAELRALRPGAAVFVGDRIVTGADSKVAIRFAEGAELMVGPATQVALSDYVLTADRRGIRGRLSLLIGIVRTHLAGLWRDGFEVETQAAVAALRSTDWITEATAGKAAVFVVNGVVEVTGTATADTVVLRGGDGTDVPVGGAPSAPKQWGRKRVDAVLARTAVP
ncbi:MAG: FecR domain-containing protein [Alphaproteobacteria bacterium]